MRFRTLLVALAAVAVAAATLAAPALAATVRHQDHQIFDAPRGGTLRVDISFADVEVRVRPGSTVEIDVDLEVTASNEDKARDYLEMNIPELRADGDEIVISTQKQKIRMWNFGSFKSKGRVTVELPPGMSVRHSSASGDFTLEGDLESGRLKANTASGDMTIRGAADDIELNAASGDVTIDPSRLIESLEVDTASGDIQAGGRYGQVKLSAASGEIEVSGLQGNATLDSASGDVTARWDRLDSDTRISVSCASGDIHLTLPRDSEIAGEIDTASGDIDVDFPGRYSDRHRRFRFDGGEDAVRLEVDSASGDVTVAAR